MADSLVHAKCAACFAQVVKWFPIDWLSLGHDVIIEQAGRPASRRVGSRLFIEVIARSAHFLKRNRCKRLLLSVCSLQKAIISKRHYGIGGAQ